MRACLHPTLCTTMGCSPPGSSVLGIFQARVLEWVSISYSKGPSWPRDHCCVSFISRWILYTEPPGKPASVCVCVLSHFSRVWLFVTLWTVTHEAPLFMGFFRQKYWRGLPCPPPGDLPNPGIKPMFLMSSVLAGRFFTTSTNWKAKCWCVDPIKNKSKTMLDMTCSYWRLAPSSSAYPQVLNESHFKKCFLNIP